MIESIYAHNCVWCNEEDFPELQKLPVSFFDKETLCPECMLVFQSELVITDFTNITCRFSGGCRFRLFINGQFVDDGPVEVGGDYNNTTPPNWWFYDERDLSEFFVQGNNLITFEVFPAGFTQMDYTDGKGWIFFELYNCENVIEISAESWRCRRNYSFIDMRQYNAFIAEDDTHWCRCIPVGDKRLMRLDLPPQKNEFIPFEEVVFPHSYNNSEVTVRRNEIVVNPGSPVFFYLRFPEEIAAHFSMEINAGELASIELEFQEQMGICPATNPTEKIISGRKKMRYRSVKMHAFKWVKITVVPTCLQSPDPSIRVKLSNLGAYKRGFPLPLRKELPQSAAKFKAVDTQCLNNLALCMHRMHLDSPIHQEGLGCTGDYRIEALMAYAGYGESRLVRADLLRTALLLRQKGKLFHTSYELSYLMMLYEYWRFTGDKEFLSELYDTVKSRISRFEGFIGENSLLSNADNYLFIDWKVESGFTYHHPPASRGTACMTAFFHQALEVCIAMSEALEDFSYASMCRYLMARIGKAFNELLWDKEKRLFCDGIPFATEVEPNKWLPADDGVISYTSHTNILALSCGLVEDFEMALTLLDRVVNDQTLLQPTPYFMHYLFEAVDRYQQWEKYGDALFSRWNVFASEGLRESWYGGDYSHAWGGSPSYWLRHINE